MARAAAPEPAVAPQADAVVARVGTTEVRRSELEFRMRALPAFQRNAMGLTAPELGRKVLEEGILYDEMLAQEARGGQASKDPRTAWQVRRAQANASLSALKARQPAVTPAEVAAYYDAHRIDFDTPERVQLWRLLASDEAAAQKVLRGLSKDTDAEKWNHLVLDASIDQATRMRGGNLGFVLPDGRSNEAGLVVDAALYKAALTVKDGEWVHVPVREGANWAVVWRRGSLKAQKRTLDEARVQIASTMLREREDSARKAEVARLRVERGVELHADLVGLVSIAPTL